MSVQIHCHPDFSVLPQAFWDFVASRLDTSQIVDGQVTLSDDEVITLMRRHTTAIALKNILPGVDFQMTNVGPS